MHCREIHPPAVLYVDVGKFRPSKNSVLPVCVSLSLRHFQRNILATDLIELDEVTSRSSGRKLNPKRNAKGSSDDAPSVRLKYNGKYDLPFRE